MSGWTMEEIQSCKAINACGEQGAGFYRDKKEPLNSGPIAGLEQVPTVTVEVLTCDKVAAF